MTLTEISYKLIKRTVERFEVSMKKITQNDIAKTLGVSRRTVARALNDDIHIDPKKKKMVLDYCKKIDYKKNIASSILAPGNTKYIHVFLIESINEHYHLDTEKGILFAQEKLLSYNIEFKIHITPIDHPLDQVTLLESVLKSHSVSGIIIIPVDSKSIKKVLEQYKITKVITIDKKISSDYSHIGKDYTQSGRISADLIRREDPNFSHSCIVNTTSDNIASELYYNGFKSYLKDNGIQEIREIFIDQLNVNCEQLPLSSFEEVKYVFIPRYAEIVIRYLHEKGIINNKFVVTGINDDIINYISDDIIIGAIQQNYFLHGYLASKAILKLTLHPNELINFTSNNEIITKENLTNLNNDFLLASLFDLL